MSKLPLAILFGSVVLSAACNDDDDRPLADGGAKDGGVLLDAGGMDASVGADSGVLTGAALVQRGRYLVDNVAACGDCHTPRLPSGAPDMTRYLAGTPCFADAVPGNAEQGCIASRNLTHHETGLKNRSDKEIKDMLLTGVRPDGKALLPIMPYYVLANMTEQDANAIVAYLRTVPPVDNMIGNHQPPIMPPPAPVPRLSEDLIPRPLPSYPDQAAAARGRYLAGNVGICMECHTPRDANDALVTTKLFQGANEFPRDLLGLPPVFPEIIYSSNITPDPTTGIGNYSVDDLVAAIKRGVDKNQGGSPLCPPMPAGPMGAFAGLTDDDARDIAHYLKSIAPGVNMVPADCQPPGFVSDAGVPDASL